MEDNKKDEQLNNGSTGSPQDPSAGSGQAELDKTKSERDEYLNGWKRAKADLINYQKDESKRLRDAMSYGSETVMRDLILVLDSLELALPDNGSPVRGREGSERASASNGMEEGFIRIKKQLEDSLKRHGLEKMKLSPGDAFDPNLHESLGEMEIELPPGTVAVEIEAGYLLNGKVVRPARVKLAK